jgi:hypothetical protein
MLQVVADRLHQGDDVKLFDPFPLYEIGGVLRHLKDVCEKEVPDGFDQLIALWSARKQIEPLLAGELIVLSYCRDAASELAAITQALEATVSAPGSGSPPEGPSVIPTYQMRRLKEKIEIFEHQLSAELKKTAAYLVPERGIFKTEGLVEEAEKHIHASVRDAVPEFAQQEFRAAGRCLAFGLYSASGFHSARAVESVLKEYYAIFLGPPPDISMGQMAARLDEMKSAKNKRPKLPRENTVRHIKDVANFDRNPLMHKNVTLEEIDATTLFNSALGVILEMSKELIEHQKSASHAVAVIGGAAADLGLLADPTSEKKGRSKAVPSEPPTS